MTTQTDTCRERRPGHPPTFPRPRLRHKTDKNSRHNLAVVHYSRGYELLAKKDNKRALADFEASWKADSSYTQALLARGIAKKRLGDEKGGEADMAQAKKLDPSLAK